MKTNQKKLMVATLFLSTLVPNVLGQEPTADRTLVFAEHNGTVAVEAEHFFEQSAISQRAFHLTTDKMAPGIKPDGDPSHVGGASGGAYLEILPDTRRTHDDQLMQGTNFSPQPGKMAILHYKVNFGTPGRYYVWVRAYSTGSEDNGLHVGIDGEWPESGQRLQWCEGKHSWRWESKQRTEKNHCGEPHKIYLDIKEPGEHTIHFSMREDGFEFDKWLMTSNRDFHRPEGVGPPSTVNAGKAPKPFPFVAPKEKPLATSPTKPVSDKPLIEPRKPDGNGSVQINGELQVWHKITLDLNGPYAHEQDNDPNPFTDCCLEVTFAHPSGATYVVPGYFAADGDAGNSSSESGTCWRVHFSPDLEGEWAYRVAFHVGPLAALNGTTAAKPLKPFDGQQGTFSVVASDKSGRDFRSHGRLQYVGKHYLQFAGSKKYFLKAGADAPETLLAFSDFDNTVANKPKVPLKTWGPHVSDWKPGDPTWKQSKGKGLIGAINYLSSKGCNAFSFLTYNAGGDGDNVWPFIERMDKLHYDCSKLDQWGVVFDHGTAKGMYLHFKLQETENDDHRHGWKKSNQQGNVPTSLDGGNLGTQRKLYCRELIARFGHNLALNWNLGEENTQTTAQQIEMSDYISNVDPYDHHIVVHTYPHQQDAIYQPLLGDRSRLTGASLQNDGLATTHADTVKWVRASAATSKPWVCAFDESGTAAHAQVPDLGYQGFDGHDNEGKLTHTQHEVRKQTLWGTLMAGGAGNEYYFGYKVAENDLMCQDWRSRDQSWGYCRIAIEFFHDHKIPFWEMANADELVGNEEHAASKYCFVKPKEVYVVYLPFGVKEGASHLDLQAATGEYKVQWFNPRIGGPLQTGTVQSVTGGTVVDLGEPPAELDEDWVALVRHSR